MALIFVVFTWPVRTSHALCMEDSIQRVQLRTSDMCTMDSGATQHQSNLVWGGEVFLVFVKLYLSNNQFVICAFLEDFFYLKKLHKL